MKNISRTYPGVVTLLLMFPAMLAVTPAVAAPFRIDWTAVVGTITGPIKAGDPVENYLTAGSFITASGIFNDTSTEMHDFDSGGNIIATYSTTDSSYEVFDILDDVDFTFSTNLQSLINATDKTLGTIYFSAYFHDIHNLTQPYHSSKYRDPGIDIWFSGEPGSSTNLGHVMWAVGGLTSRPSNTSEFYGFDLLDVTVSITPLDSAAVPEPASLLLFASGLAGLAGIRMKKKR